MIRRFLLLSVLTWCALACVGLFAGGCIVPPVLAPVGFNVFEPWEDLSPASLELPDGQVLGGWQCFLGDDAPLVLHLFESGGQATPSSYGLDRYDQLADLGFSSIAFDYRGLGRSSGERSPSKLASDSMAVYRHAVELVNGDENRVVLRASSLGTVMVAELLALGARPGAVIAFAPVEAGSIPRRYTKQFWWGFVYWPVAPFLKRLVEAQTLEELERADCPVLVVTEPADCFLSPQEVAEFQAAAESKPSLTCVIHEGKSTRARVRAPGLRRHMTLVSIARRVGAEERELLNRTFDRSGYFDARASRVLTALTPEIRARLASNAAALRRFRSLVSFDRRIFPEAAAAAALRLQDDEVELARQWVTSHYFRQPPSIRHDHYEGPASESPATFDELMRVFDLDKGDGGRWPVTDIVYARAMLERPSLVDGVPTWTRPNVEALGLALAGEIDQANDLARRPTEPVNPPITTISFTEEGSFLKIKLTNDATWTTRRVLPLLFHVDLESYYRTKGLSGSAVLVTLLKKAAWLD